MSWFTRRVQSPLDFVQTGAGAPAKAPPPVRREVNRLSIRVETGRSAAPEVPPVWAFQTFADVPRFLSLLSSGERPLIALTTAERDRVSVMELAGRVAVIVHADLQQSLLESIKAKLLQSNYAVDVKTAPVEVLRDIHAAGSRPDGVPAASRVRSKFMEAAGEWIRYALTNRATDIHLETLGSTGVVRFRVDGEIEAMRSPNGGRYPATFIESCMGSLFNNDQQAKSGNDSLFDPEKNLYCMVPYKEIPGHTLKLRFQSLKGNEGPKAVLRLLHVGDDQPTLTFEQLGYAPSQIALWQQAMDTPSGMMAIAGVTGSGKSTTLKSFIELNPNTPTSNVLTIEDPVEYPIRGAHQVPIQRDLSNPEESAKRFSEVISSFMRSDPDVVMVGEIRDRFSANAAQQLAETGHMALGTVHAHLLSGIVPRLVNPEIGLTRAVLTAPNMVTLFAYQALVPLLCQHCCLDNTGVEQTRQVTSILDNVRKLGLSPEGLRWKRPAGCTVCGNRGTHGLTVVAEMLMPEEDWLRPIREGRDTDAVEVYRSRSNRNLLDGDMTGKTVFEHALYKSLHGLVDARKCAQYDTWQRYMSHHESRDKCLAERKAT